jgi:hypothetical protein
MLTHGENMKKQARYCYLACQLSWWAMLGSNQRPLPCEGSALPLS